MNQIRRWINDIKERNQIEHNQLADIFSRLETQIELKWINGNIKVLTKEFRDAFFDHCKTSIEISSSESLTIGELYAKTEMLEKQVEKLNMYKIFCGVLAFLLTTVTATLINNLI